MPSISTFYEEPLEKEIQATFDKIYRMLEESEVKRIERVESFSNSSSSNSEYEKRNDSYDQIYARDMKTLKRLHHVADAIYKNQADSSYKSNGKHCHKKNATKPKKTSIGPCRLRREITTLLFKRNLWNSNN